MNDERGSCITDIGSASHKCQARVAVDKAGLSMNLFNFLGFEQPRADDDLMPWSRQFLLTGKKVIGYPNYESDLLNPLHLLACDLFINSRKSRYKDIHLPSGFTCNGRTVSYYEMSRYLCAIALEDFRRPVLYKDDKVKRNALNFMFQSEGVERGIARLENFIILQPFYSKKIKPVYSEIYNMLERRVYEARRYSLARIKYNEMKRENGLKEY